MRGTMPFSVAPSNGGAFGDGPANIGPELDRGQAERDPDPGVFGQASMMLRRGRTIVPDLASRKPMGTTIQSSTAQAPGKQPRWLPYGCQK